MSASPDVVPAADVQVVKPLFARWGRIESWLERIGERLNPILVKEARQAMKSRQFSITFTLLLVFGWGWSLIGVAMKMPGIYYAPTGMFMLTGYYFILAVPLLLVVPFSAYRSLAAEREDGTFELLSISTLTSRQIVTGKLGSAVLQMIVYYSALAPCIAFTYLLRGVDIVTMFLLLSYTFCASLLLSAVGLVFAGFSRSRQWQTLISVLLLLVLVLAAWSWAVFITAMLMEGVNRLPLDEPLFWISQLAVLTAVASYVVLLVLVAAAQNSFASDNRSTRIRIAMAVQSILFAGWVGYAWQKEDGWPALLIGMFFAAAHWYVYGSFLIGENAKLSPRVLRDLPVSFLGRVFLTWFNPGSGTGYVFTVANYAALTIMTVTALLVQEATGIPRIAGLANMNERFLFAMMMLFGYLTAYLGLVRLVVLLIPQRERYGLLLPFLLNVLIVLAGCAVPFFVESWMNRFRNISFGPAQATNWMWCLAEIIDRGSIDPTVFAIVLFSASVIFLLNLILASREVELVRQEAPRRVLDEEGIEAGAAQRRVL